VGKVACRGSGYVHGLRATSPTRSNDEVGQRGQRRTLIGANKSAPRDAPLPTLRAVVIIINVA
jgi:hypothetical protein